MNILYAGSYPGELGWELINWIPHVNWHASRLKFDEIHARVRSGREGLYPMVTHFLKSKQPTKNANGNRGYGIPKTDAIDIARLKEKGKVHIVDLKGIMKHLYVASKKRKFVKYSATKEGLKKWSNIHDKCILLCIRDRKFGNHKNYNPKRWNKICSRLIRFGYTPVLLGGAEIDIIQDPPDGVVNLIGKTTVDDLIPIMNRAKIAVGQSTGTMHLASLCGMPHVVWGPDRIKIRYAKTWNPFRTKQLYISQDWEPSHKTVVANTLKLLERLP